MPGPADILAVFVFAFAGATIIMYAIIGFITVHCED